MWVYELCVRMYKNAVFKTEFFLKKCPVREHNCLIQREAKYLAAVDSIDANNVKKRSTMYCICKARPIYRPTMPIGGSQNFRGQ